MKKFIVKHWAASYWIMTIVVFIALLLLCGSAQACENVSCKPDAVREWNGDTSFVDWPCGRTDTVVTEPIIETLWGGSYAATAGLASELVPYLDDTVIVPAIKITDTTTWHLSDSVPTEHGIVYIDTVGWNIPDLVPIWEYDTSTNTVSKPEKKTGGGHYEGTYSDSNPCIPTFSFPALMDCRPLWKRFPERWYVKSVDTTKEWLIIWYEGPSYGRPSDIIDTSWSDYNIDTTWAKKVSLGDVYLTPNQVIKLKWLVRAVPPDTLLRYLWRPGRLAPSIDDTCKWQDK